MATRAYWQDHGDIIGWSAPGHSSAAGVSLVSARQRQQPAADDPYTGSTSLWLHKDTFAFQSGTDPHTPGLAAPRQRQPAVPYAGSPCALATASTVPCPQNGSKTATGAVRRILPHCPLVPKVFSERNF